MDQEVSKNKESSNVVKDDATIEKDVNSKQTHTKDAKKISSLKVFILILVIAALALGGFFGYKAYKNATLPASVKSANEVKLEEQALNNHNRTQALIDAKKALSYEPNNLDLITSVAYLEEPNNPTAAKQYFNEALIQFKKQNNPDVKGKTPETYWAAAQLAYQAGQITEAKQYYQDVIQAANPHNAYQVSLADQSQAALKRLQ